MKNLAKVLMSLVAVMLISTSVFAIDPPADVEGTVTLEVAEYLVFDLGETGDLNFDFHKLDAADPEAQSTTVYVQSNVSWTASVKATASDLEGVDGLGIAVLTIDGSPMALNAPVSKSSAMTANVSFEYDFEITGNPVPGTYVTNLLYSVAKTAITTP